MHRMIVGLMAAVALPVVGGTVNVLSLGAKNDGTEDVSAIVNAATEKDALFFPAGLYKVAKPLWLKHGICGEGYSRSNRVDPSRTWFISDIDCADGSVGIVNFSGNVQVGVERIAMKCRSAECGISITGCVQNTYTFISQVGVYDGRATGVKVVGRGSRPVFIQDFTMWGATGHPEDSVGITIKGPCDCRLSNVEIMGTRIGLEALNGHTYGDNLHLWTGCMGGRDNGTWWKGTRGLVLGEGSHFSGSQIYPDTSYYAIEQLGKGGCCEISNLMYWEDESIKVAPEKTGEFYHREPGSTAKLVVNGGLIGVVGTDENPCWMKKVYAPEAEVRGVVVESEYAISTNNIDRLCFGRELPDYEERYAERGWCKAADILAAARTGSCAGVLALGDGAAWRITFVKAAEGETEVGIMPLNKLCAAHKVKMSEREGVVKAYVLNETAAEMSVRFTTIYMGDRFRPVDHGSLRTHGPRKSRCHEVLESL